MPGEVLDLIVDGGRRDIAADPQVKPSLGYTIQDGVHSLADVGGALALPGKRVREGCRSRTNLWRNIAEQNG